MKWPWHREPEDPRPLRDGPRADPEQARAELEETLAQRPEVVELARQIREHVRQNNFAANVFRLDPSRRR